MIAQTPRRFLARLTARRHQRRAAVMAAVLTVPTVGLFCSSPNAVAQSTSPTWTGGSPDFDNWSDTRNWVNGQKPSGGGTDIVSFAGSARLAPNNDYNAYTTFNQILFASGAGSFTLGGNAIKLAANNGSVAKVENSSSVLQTVNFNSSGQSIVFNGSGELDPTSGDLTINNNIVVDGSGTQTINVYGNNHVLTLNGALGNGTATAALALQTANTVILNGANTYTGGTAINAGVLQLGSGSTTGSLAITSAISVASGAKLIFNRSNAVTQGTDFSTAAISGAGSLTQAGSGTLTLNAVNTYTGGTAINAGTVRLGNAAALGTSGAISFGGGTLQYGTGITTDLSSRFSTATGQTFSVDTNGNNVTFASALGGGNSTFTKSGAGTLQLDNAGSSFTGNFIINGGTVQTGARGTNGGNTAFGSDAAAGRTITINPGATLSFTNNNIFGSGTANATTLPTLVINGGTVTSTRYTSIGGVTLNGGTLTQNVSDGGSYQGYQLLGAVNVVGSAPSTISTTTGNVKGDHLAANTVFTVAQTGAVGGDLIVSAPLINQSGDFGGTGGLTKAGAGTMVLSGANTYTGATTISAGTLQLGGGGTTGSLSTSSAISNNTAGGVFAVNRSNAVAQGADFSAAALTGAGGFAQLGAGATTLNAANTYTGPTTVNAGTLNLTGSLTSAVTVNGGGTLASSGNGTTTGRTTGSLTVAGGGAVTLAAGSSSTPLTVGGALTLGGTGAYGGGQYATLNFTLGGGVEALNAAGALTLNSGGAYVSLTGATAVGTYNLLTFSSKTEAGAFSLSSTTAGVTTQQLGRNTYMLLDNATALQLQVTGAAVPNVAFFNGAVSSRWNDLSNASVVNFATNLAGTADAGNIPGATTDVILNASNAPAARTASETLGGNTTINSLNVNGNGTTTLAADGSTLTINALADTNTASDNSYTGNAAGTGISIAGGANAFTVNVPVALGNSQSWTNNSASLFTVGGSTVSGTATTGNTQTLTMANTGAGGTTVSAVIGNGTLGGNLALSVNNTGAGTTILTGNNTYTGGTTISAGTLQVSGTGVLGGGSVVNNGALVFNTTAAQTIAGVISGTGTLTQGGTGAITLTGNNTFSGGLAINNGATVNANSGGGNLGAGPVTVGSTVGGSGTLNFNVNGVQFANSFVLNGGTINNGNGNTVLGGTANTIVVNGATTLTSSFGYGTNAAFANGNAGKALELNGVLSGGAALTLNGVNNPFNEASGIWINNNANTYGGTVTVNANSGNGLAVTLGGNTALQNATVNVVGVSGNAQTPYGLGFSGFANAGVNGDFTTVTAPVIGALSGNGNIALQTWQRTVQNSEGTGAAVALTTGGNNATTTFSGILSGTGSLTKAGTGTMTLTGANTYSGGTTVNGGTLLVNGSTGAATGAVTVNNTGTLGGTGSIGGATTINGGGQITGAAAGSVGTLTLAANTSFTGTSGSLATFLVDLNATTADRLTITGNLDLSTTFDQISFNSIAAPTAASYTLASYTGILTGTFDVVANLPANYALQYNPNEIDLVAVPEPGTVAAGLLALGALGLSQRRRVRRFLTARRLSRMAQAA